jgi:peptidoglycan/LPS O-acetylase OafA/YrhL
MRGIAILLVLFVHSAGMTNAITGASWGWLAINATIAVPLFFAISGFLLYRPYVSEHAGLRRAPALRLYARRRLLRILPAYWGALTLLALWPGIQDVFTTRWWVYYGFLQVYSTNTITNGIPIAWSLCVEMTFYLLLPLFAATAGRLTMRWQSRPWWQAQALLIGSFGLLGLLGRALVQLQVLPVWAANTLASTTQFFAAGMALAVLSVALERSRRGHRGAVAWLSDGWLAHLAWAGALAAFLVAARVVDVYDFLLNPARKGPGAGIVVAHNALLAVTVTLALVPAVFGAGGAIRRLLAWTPLAYVGLVSYGMYLWHVPLTAWLSGWHGPPDPIPDIAGGLHVQNLFGGHGKTPLLLLAAVAFSIAAGTLSYRIVELPFLRRKERAPKAVPIEGRVVPATD